MPMGMPYPKGAMSMTKKKKPAGKKAHPGFKAVQEQIAKKQGISSERAGAILAAGARKASPKAVAANPRLKNVRGMRRGY
jgi:hypothetical protein